MARYVGSWPRCGSVVAGLTAAIFQWRRTAVAVLGRCVNAVHHRCVLQATVELSCRIAWRGGGGVGNWVVAKPRRHGAVDQRSPPPGSRCIIPVIEFFKETIRRSRGVGRRAVAIDRRGGVRQRHQRRRRRCKIPVAGFLWAIIRRGGRVGRRRAGAGRKIIGKRPRGWGVGRRGPLGRRGREIGVERRPDRGIMGHRRDWARRGVNRRERRRDRPVERRDGRVVPPRPPILRRAERADRVREMGGIEWARRGVVVWRSVRWRRRHGRRTRDAARACSAAGQAEEIGAARWCEVWLCVCRFCPRRLSAVACDRKCSGRRSAVDCGKAIWRSKKKEVGGVRGKRLGCG